MLSRMDARQHRDLIHTIVQALMHARYAPLMRRKSAWREGYDEDLARARRVAEAIVNALHTANFRIDRNPPAPHHSTPPGCRIAQSGSSRLAAVAVASAAPDLENANSVKLADGE